MFIRSWLKSVFVSGPTAPIRRAGPAHRRAKPWLEALEDRSTPAVIDVTANSVLTGYTTLKAAFDAINAGTHTGAIAIAVNGDTTETASAVLNASGSGSASYTTITISPAGGAARAISGAINGAPLINLNGADNVSINGLNTGGNSLTLSNTDATGTTLQFINDASNNSIAATTLLGTNTSTTGGVVVFGTTTGTTGNDNNTIDNCDISDGASAPTNAILSIGSTTTAAANNSGNTITNSRVSDYFSASSITTGILLGAGNTDWTISNNRLFQSATRTYTTANTHTGINIQSGAGYTISGNTIGFADAGGTGTTNMVGLTSGALGGTFPSSYTVGGTANATRYIAINAAFTAGGTVSSIQGNTVAGFALYTSSGATTTNGIFCGIAVTSGNVNIGTTTGNTIGATSGNGSIYTATTTTGGIISGIFVTSSNAVAIRNNTIGALDAMGTSATVSGGINGINIAGASSSYDVSGNTIGNSTNPNLRMGNLTTAGNLSNVGTSFTVATGFGQFNGILSSQTGAGTIGTQALPNVIRNASLNSSATATATSIRGITASGIPTISSNSITNLTTQSANVGLASTLLAGMGIFLNSISTAGAVVQNNTINSLSLANTTATGTNIAGIAIYAGSSSFTGNKIFDITNASTSVSTTTPGTASGFFLRQPAGVQSIVNNMVSLGTGQTTDTAFNGIWQQNSAVAYTLNAYNNTINIGGTAAAGAQPSFGINRGSYSATQVLTPVDIRNNVITNTRSGGTGSHYAIGNNIGALPTATGWGANASNTNVLNANAATVGYWGSALDFANWQATSASDAGSFSGITVNYANAANGDLHLNMGVTPTLLESNGQAIPGVTTDFDGQVRPGPAGSVNGGGIAPDLGADEFDGVPIDIFAPVVTYSSLPNTTLTANRTISVTITDVTGVATGGLAPRIYFNKNGGAYSSTALTLSSGTVQNGVWTATINHALLGGVAANDVINYFVVAQDTLGQLSANPSAGFSGTDVNTVTTPPTTPRAYTIVTPFPTTVNVGPTETITSLTNAGGLFEAMNAGVLTGNVTVNITGDMTSETGAVVLNQLVEEGAGAGSYTVLIRPSGAPRVVSGSSTAASALIKLNGADRVTIDGSLSGGTDRSLTISSTTGGAVVWLGSASTTNGANSNVVKNCTISGTAATVVVGVVSGSGTTLGNAAEAPNSNNTIRNNLIFGAQNAVYISGEGTSLDQNWLVTGNTFGSTTAAEKMSFRGMLIGNAQNFTVSNNTINGVISTTTSTATMSGIQVAFTINGGTITGNRISDIKQTNTGGWGSNGIFLAAASTASNLTVANNFIWDVASQGFNGVGAADNGYGIMVTTGGGYKIYYNSVNMNTDQGSGAATGITAAINVASTVTTAGAIDLRNNIFSNSQTLGTRYAIYSAAPATVFSSINRNNYFSTGSVGFLGVARPTLADWQTATGSDANSVAGDPLFVSPTDLHITNPSSPAWQTGTPIPGITTDIDGNTRSATTPSMGGDEPLAPPTLAGVLVNGTTAPSAALTNSRVTNLVLNFSTAVNIAPGAFSLTNGTSTITSNAGGAISVAGSGTSTITLTFTGSSGVDFTSLADGIWTLSTNMTLVTAVSGGAAGTGTTTTNNIRRLYGDIDNNGVVNSDDFDQFGNTFGLAVGEPGYLAGFDFDNNSVINSDDFDQFGNRFGIAL